MKGYLAWFVLFLLFVLSATTNVVFWQRMQEMECHGRGLVQVLRPEASESALVRVDTLLVHDTVYVEIPIVQKVYRTDEFEAYVSGWRPALDSLYVYPKIVRESANLRRFSVGLSGGYGMTPAGMQPYVGLGVTYRIW